MVETISNTPGKKPVADVSLEQTGSEFLRALQEGGLKNLQQLDLSIVLGGHDSANDAEQLFQYIKGADVFIPEMTGYPSGGERQWNLLTSGQGLPLASKHIYLTKLRQFLYNSKIKVAFADIPKDSRAHDIGKRAYEKWMGAINHVASRNLPREAATNYLIERVQAYAETLPMRERYITSHLCPAILRATADRQDRDKIQRLRVVMSMGYGHARLEDMLRGKHPPTQAIKPSDYIERYVDEVVVRTIAGETISKDLADNTFVEEIINMYIGGPLVQNDVDVSRYNLILRRLTDALVPLERDQLYALILEGDDPHVTDEILKLLHEKGVARVDGGVIYPLTQ